MSKLMGNKQRIGDVASVLYRGELGIESLWLSGRSLRLVLEQSLFVSSTKYNVETVNPLGSCSRR
jgi:hypothetical protein